MRQQRCHLCGTWDVDFSLYYYWVTIPICSDRKCFSSSRLVMFRFYMSFQMSSLCCSIVTLITRVFDTFMKGFDMIS